MEWVNIIIQGVLIGGLYAMFAAGLALIFGVMRLVNIAHGDLIVLAAYIALMTTDTIGINPLLAIVIVVPTIAVNGYALQPALLNRHVFALAMALSLAVIAVAGVFLAVRTNFDPAIGPARLIFGFEAVIIGGLGSMWGTLAGGIVLGVSQAIGAQINPGWQLLAGHLAFLLILAVRPEGLFPKVQG